jgi:choline dehydrogenase-like flavoprotein
MAAAFPGHPNNWSFTGALSPDLSYSVPRGKIVGGSSSINGGYFVRGTRDDFDRWAEDGNPRWSFDDVLPAFRRLEHDLDYRDEFHGDSGPVPVRRHFAALEHPVTAAFFECSLALGFEEEKDKNAPGRPGVGLVPQNIVDGRRINAAMSYLLPNLDRQNLEVRGGHFVRRVLFRGRRAAGVEFETGGRVDQVCADEVVLCAGAVNSPHLLMLSGVGPTDELRRQDIDVVQHAPGVGKEFVDHPHVTVGYRPVEGLPAMPLTAFVPACLSWTTERSPYVGDAEILLRMAPFGALIVGASSGSMLSGIAQILKRPLRTARSLRGVSLRRAIDEARRRGDLSLGIGLQQPESRGEMRLVSSNPAVQPQISYHYLGSAFDVRRMREGIRVAVELLETAPFSALVGERTEPTTAHLASDNALNTWMRTHLGTAVHLSRSCHMGPDEDETAVVDELCRVRGVENLRVVDTSIMPSITSRGVNATAVMIGERAADLMREPPGGRP